MTSITFNVKIILPSVVIYNHNAVNMWKIVCYTVNRLPQNVGLLFSLLV